MIIGIFAFIVGGLLFIYFNMMACFKLNLTAHFVNISVLVIIFKKKYILHQKIIYKDFANKLIARYKRTKEVDKVKWHFKHFEYVRKISRYFIIKNIHLYPDSIENNSSFAIEFIVVNNVLKKSLFNG